MVIESRIELLKKLNEIMMCMNDEDCYFTWVLIVPDEATDDDFQSIALDEESFNEVLDLFEKLFHRYRRYE